MTNQQALFIIWNAILNQSQEAKKTINNTIVLMERLGLLNDFCSSFEALDYDSLHSAMVSKPMVHRFYNKMTRDLYLSVIHIENQFGGSPLKVFLCQNKQAVINNLLEFKGIGLHKAELAYLMFHLFEDNDDSLDRSIEHYFRLCPSIYETLGLEIEILNNLVEKEVLQSD